MLARSDQRAALRFERSAFLLETGQDCFSPQERIARRDRAPAENDSFRGNELAAERGELEIAGALLEFESGGEIGGNCHVAQKLPNEWCQRFRRVDFFGRPSQRTFRKFRARSVCVSR